MNVTAAAAIAAYSAPRSYAPPVPPVTATPQAQQPTANPAAAMAAQQISQPVRTQTVQAPQAVGRTDAPREVRTGTETGRSLDTAAAVSEAQTNGTAPRRGKLLDLSV